MNKKGSFGRSALLAIFGLALLLMAPAHYLAEYRAPSPAAHELAPDGAVEAN